MLVSYDAKSSSEKNKQKERTDSRSIRKEGHGIY